MADVETRRFLHQIDTNVVIQQYLKEACCDLYEIIHLMSMSTCCHVVDSYRTTQPPGKARVSHAHKYQQNMHFLMKLGTTQNCTHPGSVRNNDVCSVFSHGNTRERCALLMNMLCNDKRYCIMNWVLRHDQENKAASNKHHTSVLENANNVEIVKDFQYHVWQVVPSCLNEVQVAIYRQAMRPHKSGVGNNNSQFTSSLSSCAKKDMRKTLCKISNCPRKNTRSTRPLHLQHSYALPAANAVPALSQREKVLINETRARSALFLFRKPSASGLPNRVASAHGTPLPVPLASDYGNNKPNSNSVSQSLLLSHDTPLPTTKGLCTRFSTQQSLMHHKQKSRVSPLSHQGYVDILPWLTGRMCWTMLQDSAFFVHASRHNHEMISGPSGHTHALLTFMRIFRKFDVRKWTLICIVWLVGADHHSIHEVLVAALRHGLVLPSEVNSLDVARTLLRIVTANPKKSAWGPIAKVDCGAGGIGASF